MENQNNNETFTYTYSAAQQDEVQKIRKKYLPQEEDKMEQLRRLDHGVTQKATMVSLIVGILGALLLGVGMCCTIVWTGVWFIPGIFVGLVGMAVAALAYPVYISVVKKERERVAPEIMRLTDELLK